MIKVQFVCDKCKGVTSSISEDLSIVYCNSCNYAENLERPLNMLPHEPKLTLRAFTAFDPEGVEYEAMGVAYFARKHNLSNTMVYSCIRNSKKSYKGWTFIDKGIQYFHTSKERDAAYRS